MENLHIKVSMHPLIQPVSYKEFVELSQIDKSSPEWPEKSLLSYIEYGSLPWVHKLANREQAYLVLASIFDSLILNEVVAKNQIDNYSDLQNLILYILENIGRVCPDESIKNHLESQASVISLETINRYLSYLESASLLYRFKAIDIEKNTKLNDYQKFYVSNIGFKHAKTNYYPEDINAFLENIVLLELTKKGYTISLGRLGEQGEVNFVATKDDEVSYFQIEYNINDSYALERKLSPLLEITNQNPKYILSYSKEEKDQDGIKLRNLQQWLLS